MTNKRKYPRVTIKAVGEVLCLDDDRKFKAFVGGISRGGLEIYAHEPVKKGCRLKITLRFLDKDGKPRDELISGEVRWTAPFHEAYLSGIELTHLLDKKENPILTDYVENAERFFASSS